MAVPVPSAQAFPAPEYVKPASGNVRCVILKDKVACEATSTTGFVQAPMAHAGPQCPNSLCPNGAHFDMAEVTASGVFMWHDGHIGGAAVDARVLSELETILGWTVKPDEDGLWFTKNGTGHGMFASVAIVKPI
jgi:hypothetical protein